MPLIPAILIATAVGAFVWLLLDYLDRPRAVEPEPEPEFEPSPHDGVATPYREALEAAFRIQQAAWIAEQQIYVEAARHRVLPRIEGRSDA